MVPVDDRRAGRGHRHRAEVDGPRAPTSRAGVAIRWRRGPAVRVYGVALPRRRRRASRRPAAVPRRRPRPARASDIVAVAYSDPRSREDGERALEILVGLLRRRAPRRARPGRTAGAAAGRAVGDVPRRADLALHAAPRSRLPERPADHLDRRADGDRPGSRRRRTARAAGPARPRRRRDADAAGDGHPPEAAERVPARRPEPVAGDRRRATRAPARSGSTSGRPARPRCVASISYYRGRSDLAGVSIAEYPSQREAWSAMMRGDVDVLYDIAPDAFEFVKESPNAHIASYLRPVRHRPDLQHGASAPRPPRRPAGAEPGDRSGAGDRHRRRRPRRARPSITSGRTTGPATPARRRSPSTRPPPAPRSTPPACAARPAPGRRRVSASPAWSRPIRASSAWRC